MCNREGASPSLREEVLPSSPSSTMPVLGGSRIDRYRLIAHRSGTDAVPISRKTIIIRISERAMLTM